MYNAGEDRMGGICRSGKLDTKSHGMKNAEVSDMDSQTGK